MSSNVDSVVNLLHVKLVFVVFVEVVAFLAVEHTHLELGDHEAFLVDLIKNVPRFAHHVRFHHPKRPVNQVQDTPTLTEYHMTIMVKIHLH